MPSLSVHAAGMRLSTPVLRRLYEDWKVRRRFRIPLGADFDPAALRYILGSISLIEVRRDPLRFRARVHGTKLAARVGVELTGKYFDEVPSSQYLRLVQAHFTDVVMNERPSFGWLMNGSVNPPIWENESLVLPLSRDGNRVDFLLSAAVQHRRLSPTEIAVPYNRLAPLE